MNMTPIAFENWKPIGPAVERYMQEPSTTSQFRLTHWHDGSWEAAVEDRLDRCYIVSASATTMQEAIAKLEERLKKHLESVRL